MEDHHYPIDVIKHIIKFLKFSIKYEANINEKINDNGDTLLILLIKACMSENLEEIKKWLVDNGSDINIKNYDDDTTLIIAIEEKKRDLKIIKYLINNKADIN
ncbi:hypothetical protein PIROE2DRAFT_18962, partial [Piromyces sp. E2]